MGLPESVQKELGDVVSVPDKHRFVADNMNDALDTRKLLSSKWVISE
jgi:hypothetical protein